MIMCRGEENSEMGMGRQGSREQSVEKKIVGVGRDDRSEGKLSAGKRIIGEEVENLPE